MTAKTVASQEIAIRVHWLTLDKEPKEGAVMLIPEQFIARYGDQAAFVINVSGGKESTRMLGFLRSQFPTIPAYCVMSAGRGGNSANQYPI